MKRDIVIVDDKINKIIADQKEMKQAIDRLDSLFYSESEESVKLRAEIRSSIGELMEQFRMTQANLTDLQDKVINMSEREPGRFAAKPQIVQADSTDTTAPPVIPGIDCQELYDESFINIRRGQYEEAIQGFTDYLKYCGSQESADNARFWIGEAYYSMEKFREAIDEFGQLLNLHPDSEKRSGALYKMARSYEELGQKKDAKENFQKLVDDFPGTLEAEQAQEKLKELK
ncbi:MAG: tol-pal system protein YbgF [Candidatus Zixiibacteriota bacterium]|nr:MAG: tol-pal system protein YbgF [candidate division Zixibacteria bacterium]